jgi:hypothetical protein
MVGFVYMRLSRNFGVFEGVVIVLILVVMGRCFRQVSCFVLPVIDVAVSSSCVTKTMIEMRRKVKARFWSY